MLVVALLGAAIVLLVVLVFTLIGGDDSADDPGAAESTEADRRDTAATGPTVVDVPPATATPDTATPDTATPDTATPDVTPAVTDSLFVGDVVAPILDEVAVARGADPLRVLKTLVYPEYLFIQVQDPSIPENVDEYRWRGGLAEPDPVRLFPGTDLAVALYSTDEVDWSAIPALVEAAPEAVGIADGEVSHVIVERPLPFSPDVRMRVFVTSARSNGYADADADGEIFAVNGS
jgi:hypothetical protein